MILISMNFINILQYLAIWCQFDVSLKIEFCFFFLFLLKYDRILEVLIKLSIFFFLYNSQNKADRSIQCIAYKYYQGHSPHYFQQINFVLVESSNNINNMTLIRLSLSTILHIAITGEFNSKLVSKSCIYYEETRIFSNTKSKNHLMRISSTYYYFY